ncbi:MAG: translation initiation factor IF-2 N-terminal domain-containing protein, partial [Sulfurovaceae bacterium]|nr:translation initiation factor IF-2 N-terminal domain-containing protein [Sulfurovaceae bacterium]
MDRVKIQEIAVEAGASNAVLIEKAKELGYDVKAANSTVTVDEAGILVDYVINGVKPKSAEKPKMKVVKKAEAEQSEVEKSEVEISKVEKETKEEIPSPVVVEKKAEKKPALKTGIKKSSKRGSITISPKKRKIEIVEVIQEPKAPLVEKVEASVEVETKTVETAEVPTEEKSNVIETSPVETENEIKTEKAEVKAPAETEATETTTDTETTETPETATAQKRKARRKRAGITVVKKADREKPRIRIVEERRPESTINITSKGKPRGMPTPPSRKKAKKIAQAKETGERLDFMSNTGFGGHGRNQVTEVEEEPEIMMLDFSDKNIYEDMMRQEAKRKEEAKKRAAAGGVQQNRGRIGGHRRRPSGLRRGGKRKKYMREESTGPITSIQIPENVRVYEFAEKVGRSTGEVIKVLFTLGTMFTQNDFLDKDSIEILAEEF